MVGPIRFDGLSSGIDYTSIITQLLAIQRRPLATFENRILNLNDKKAGMLAVSANLLSFKSAVDLLSRPSFLNRTLASSSDEDILKVSGDTASVTGAFTFRVAKIAQANALLSNGFASASATVASSDSTIRVEVGNGFIDRDTPVSFLNGQTGVDRGFISITDSSGDTAVIDLQGAVTVGDIVGRINSTTGIQVDATIDADRLVIEDTAGGAGSLTITNFGADTTATDLGIAGTVAGPAPIMFGSNINRLTTTSSLKALNDGLGVRANTTGVSDFAIKYLDGGTPTSFNVDIATTASTIQDVINAINTATGNGGDITAILGPDGNSIRLNGGVGITTVSVSAAADSLAAVDLGFGVITAGAFGSVTPLDSGTGATAAAGTILVGNRVQSSLNSLLRNTLNGGQELIAGDIQGVRDGTVTFTDKAGNSATLRLDRRAATNNNGVIAIGATTINVDDPEFFAPGNRFLIVGDSGMEVRTVTDVDTGTGTITFDDGLDNAYADNRTVYAINESAEDIERLINFQLADAGVGITVGQNLPGNGLLVTDTTGGSGLLTVTNATGNAANDLAIAASTSGTTIDGGDLDPQYIGLNTALSTLNQGAGVMKGKIRITDTTGLTFDVNLTSTNLDTIGEVIREINISASTAGSALTARISNTGDGILLDDPAGGSGLLKVTEVGTTRTARDLNIAGTAESATPGTIDGANEFEIEIEAGDDVQDVVNAFNNGSAPLRATLLNTGDPLNPFKISLVSKVTGEPGRLVVDPQFSGLSFTLSSKAQNAALLYGADGSEADPVLITSSSNRFTNVIQGVTLDAKSASDDVVTVTIERDTQAIIDQVSRLVESFNKTIAEIKKLTKFDPDNPDAKGVLFGESVLRRVQRDLSRIITDEVGIIPEGQLRALSDIGIKFGTGGKLTFDSSKLENALDTTFTQVEALFTKQRPLSVGVLLEDFHRGLGVRAVDGDDDLRIIKRNGDFFDVALGTATTVGNVQSAVTNDAGNGGDITFAISADGFRLTLTDDSLISRDADGGSTSTLSEGAFTGSPVDFEGARITFGAASANPNAVVTIDSFNSATGLFTFNETLGNPVAVGDDYTLERPLEVTPLNSSKAAGDLGIRKAAELGEDDLVGSIIVLTEAPGKMFEMSDRLDFMTRPDDGLISIRVDSFDDTIDSLEKTIERGEERIREAEQRLIREFARLETLLAQNAQMMSRLRAAQSGMLSFSQGGGRS